MARPTLAALRAAWVLAVALIVGLYVAGSAIAVHRPDLVLTPTVTKALAEIGLSQSPVVIAAVLVIPAVFFLTAAVLLWRKSDEPTGLIFGLILVLLQAGTSRSLSVLEQMESLRVASHGRCK